ncbi:MAG: deoxyuridine 5'-triphosphate nucleotidohydrolase, partial [Anaeroplasmataceae bacterium]
MNITKFEKVSLNQFIKDCMDTFENTYSKEEITEIYNNIKLPKRATMYSAGYDFYSPFNLNVDTSNTVKIPTGIKVYMKQNQVLQLFPRSSLGFKYRLQLDNTVG